MKNHLRQYAILKESLELHAQKAAQQVLSSASGLLQSVMKEVCKMVIWLGVMLEFCEVKLLLGSCGHQVSFWLQA